MSIPKRLREDIAIKSVHGLPQGLYRDIGSIADARKLKKWFDGGISGKKICWSGDSTTQNLTTFQTPALNEDGSAGLAQVYYPGLRDVTVYARGANGEKFARFLSGSLLAGFNIDDIIALNCDLYILCWGINDCINTDPTTGYTAANLQTHLITAVDTIKTALPNACVILRMPNSHRTGAALITAPATAQNMMDRYQTAYRAMRDYHDDVLLWDSMSGMYSNIALDSLSSSPLLNTDGLHPSSVSYGLTIRSILRLALPEVTARDTDWRNEKSLSLPLSYDKTAGKTIWHPDADPLQLEGPDWYKVFQVIVGTDAQSHYNIGFCNYTSKSVGKPVPGRFAWGKQTVTITEANPGVVTLAGHAIPDGTAVELHTTGTLPTNLAQNTKYYTKAAAANTFELSLTSGGASINTTGVIQAGVHGVAIYGAVAPGLVPGDVISWDNRRNRMNTFVINDAPAGLQTPSTGTLRWYNSPFHPSGRSKAVTITNASPAVLTWANHDLNNGETLSLSTNGVLPAGLATAAVYYVVNANRTAGTFEVSATSGGASINTTNAGSGSHAVVITNTGHYGYVYRHKYAFCDDLRAAIKLLTNPPTFEVSVSSNINPYAATRRFYITAATATSVTIRALEEGNGNITDTTVYDYSTNKANVRIFIPGVTAAANSEDFGVSLAAATLTYDTSADTIAITGLTGVDCRNAVIPQGYLLSIA